LVAARATLAPIVVARAASALVVLATLAACGSADELPPGAEPAPSPPIAEPPAGRVVDAGGSPLPGAGRAAVDGGRAFAVVSRRERVLDVYDARTRRRIASAPAGVGPTNVAGGPGGLIYVVDTTGDGLLVFELRPRLRLTRRLPIAGRPYGIAADPANGRLWVSTTATNRLVELADGARPHHLSDLPAVRAPEAVAVRDGRVYVSGRADGVLQIVDARGR
jgi:DNA-binding beta-propeller fold protein YncE